MEKVTKNEDFRIGNWRAVIPCCLVAFVVLCSASLVSTGSADDKDVLARQIEAVSSRIARRPNATLLLQRSMLYHHQGDTEKARQDVLESTRLARDWSTLNLNAWHILESPKDGFRDGLLALDIALEANRRTRFSSPQELDTLAAAYAESGDFATAIRYQQRVLELVRGKVAFQAFEPMARQHLELYRQGRPVADSRESSGSKQLP